MLALGRIETSQEFLREAISDVRVDQRGFRTSLGRIETKLAVFNERLDGHDRRLDVADGLASPEGTAPTAKQVGIGTAILSGLAAAGTWLSHHLGGGSSP
jgi:hypothetical protein